MAGGGGGAWKVAYADFVTAMMAFFMVMWLTSQKPEVKEALAQHFSDPWARYRKNSNLNRKPTLKEPKAGENPPRKSSMGSNPMLEPHDEPESPTASKPRLTTVRAPERTTIGATVQFLPGSDELTPESELRLKNLVPQLKGRQQKIDIRGHTSMQAASVAKDDSSYDLSFFRCKRVKRYLEELGVESERMRLGQAGPHEPIVLNQKPGDEDKNSRVEVFLMAETVESLKGSKNPPAKTKDLDEAGTQQWLLENDPAAAKPAEKKGH